MTQSDTLPAGDPELRGEDATSASFHRGTTMHGLFASCVRQHPDATAIVHRESRLTYSELDELSDFYGVALEQAGVGPGDFVPVIMERSPRLIGLLLAVLKRGAAYCAPDPQWPSARLASLVARLRPPLVITGVEGPWPVPAWVPPAHDPAAPRRRPSPVPAGPDDPCTILFTSGSTGDPKGVVSPHRSIVRLFDDCDWMPLGPGRAMPQVATMSWDASMIDCWGPLLTGGTTVLTEDRILLPAALSEMHDRQGVNVMCLTPRLFNMLVEEGVQAFNGVHTVLLGGEKVSPAHARRFLENHPGAHLINGYGPSECGVLVSAHEISLADCDAAGGIPLGRPVPYSGIHILDGSQVTEDGQVGEICVAGAGLAIGYLDDAELTGRQFIDVDMDGARRRVYRTGDLGHWSGDRTLFFDGRIDRQLKVRGYRIEPGEIELAATRVPGITMSAVVPLRRDGVVDALALFYASPQARVSEADLGAELSRQLPHYLVPRRIRRLDRFPLLVNGKLDRLLLETIISATEPAPASGEDPHGASEIAVADVFAEILGTSAAARTVSLFDLGGDSLSVARVCARLEQATGVRVPTSQVYRTPTVAGLAAWLGVARTERPPQPGPAADRATERLITLTPMQAQVAPRHMVGELAWWIDGSVDDAALERAASDIHRRHQALHARYLVTSLADDGHAMIPADPGDAQFHRLPDVGTDAAATGAIRAVLRQPIRLDQGEVWRCALVHNTKSERSLFGIVVHSTALDGRSAEILTAELSAAYAARAAGNEPEFGAPVASLADLETAYRAQLAATDLDAQRQYWRSEFSGLRQCRLPGHSVAPVPDHGPVAAPAFAVDPAHLRSWESYGRSRGMTLFVWVAAVYAEALISAGAPQDIGLMCPTANRGSDLLDRSITSRMGMAVLRPNGPSRAGRHVLARTHDAYNKAMAATDVLLDLREIMRAVGEPQADSPVLPEMPFLVFQEPLPPTIKLGGATGTLAPEFVGLTDSVVDLYLEVQTSSAAGMLVRVVVRTEVYPAGLADRIGSSFLEILREGPERLEQRTAR